MKKTLTILLFVLGLLLPTVAHADPPADPMRQPPNTSPHGLYPTSPVRTPLALAVSEGGRAEVIAKQEVERIATRWWVTKTYYSTRNSGSYLPGIRWNLTKCRTFTWLGRFRRLSKDYEGALCCSEDMIYIASIQTLLNRAAKLT